MTPNKPIVTSPFFLLEKVQGIKSGIKCSNFLELLICIIELFCCGSAITSKKYTIEYWLEKTINK